LPSGVRDVPTDTPSLKLASFPREPCYPDRMCKGIQPGIQLHGCGSNIVAPRADGSRTYRLHSDIFRTDLFVFDKSRNFTHSEKFNVFFLTAYRSRHTSLRRLLEPVLTSTFRPLNPKETADGQSYFHFKFPPHLHVSVIAFSFSFIQIYIFS
jgi:hypothetical protein